jgi:DNA-binding beta-propeller fold protein YncE
MVSTVAGGGNTAAGYVNGVGTGAIFYNPYGISVSSSGNMYVVDYGNHLIRMIDSTGTYNVGGWVVILCYI